MNILCIGNSFSQDATRYLQEISNGELYVRNLYIGGCSLETHYNNIINDKADYEYQKDASKLDMISIKEALQRKKWDFITVQQVSHFSGMEETYEPYLPFILGYLKCACPNAKVVFHRTWAYSDNSQHGGFANYGNSRPKMFKAIVDTTKRICKRHSLEIIPNGDAVEKARKLATFKEDKRPITRDGFHLSFDYGRYLAGLVMYRFFTGKDATKVTFMPENTNPKICEKLKEIAQKSFKG